MSLKRNFIYNAILTVSQYITPLFVYPYISRIFGIEKIGIVNWVDSTINYVLVFSMLGISVTGIRAVAENKNDKKELQKVYSELLLIHFILTLVFLIGYVVIVLSVKEFQEHSELFWIGCLKIVFNLFLLEWFFKGTEDFKYITTRSIFIKLLYTALVFIFIKDKEDLNLYFFLTCLVVVFNSLYNLVYSSKYIRFSLKGINLKRHLKSILTVGAFLLLSNMYTTFNVTYLGLVNSDESVGAYTTGLKLYSVIIAIFSSLNTVLIPRMSSLLIKKDYSQFSKLVKKSLTIVLTLSFPIIAFCFFTSEELITMLAGSGFERAIICFKIILPMVLVIGLAQVFSNQVLLALKRDKNILFATLFGAISGITLNFLLVKDLGEIGSSITIVISESVVMISTFYFARDYILREFPYRILVINLLGIVPFGFIVNQISGFNFSTILNVSIILFITIIYYSTLNIFIVRNTLLIDNLKRIYEKF
jgi:O-antigen/teichoic acid export membrane protein